MVALLPHRCSDKYNQKASIPDGIHVEDYINPPSRNHELDVDYKS